MEDRQLFARFLWPADGPIRLIILLTAGATLFIAGCGSRQTADGSDKTDLAAKEITVYVSTDRVFSELILKAFEKKTGVKVNAVYDTEETKSTGLANRLLAEKKQPAGGCLLVERASANSCAQE
jgi:ABC-type glycerol-3-phosphate transport system substrate-binding protein